MNETTWAAINAGREQARIARETREEAERPAQIAAAQAARRAELESYDQAAARRAADPFYSQPCAGGCTRGGEGPACGRSGCQG